MHKPSIKCTIQVWNLPLRIFHWGLALCFVTAWSTLGSRHLDIHTFAGYTMAGLILFRLAWGIIGGPYARFRDFSFNWQQVSSYLLSLKERRPERFIGHNPAGSWAIYALLGMSSLIAISGLLTLGGEERHGPFAERLSFSQGDIAHQIHELLAWSTLALIALHLGGVVVESLLHKENLTRTMLSGQKRGATGARSVASRRKTGFAMLLVILLFGGYQFQGYLIATPDNPYRPFIGPKLAESALWRDECGGCHLAFHPSLLPMRSWKRMLQEQGNHFEEALFLEADTIAELEHFLAGNTAEQAATEAAWKIDRSIAPNESPLAITKTAYWRQKHQTMPEEVWQMTAIKSKSDCAACHLDADAGTFEDGAMHLPSESQS